MDVPNGTEKPWDHPWSTDEMRQKRREWSLASDVGLLKHLQQFSENLTSKTNKTHEVLNSLTTQLNETAILIENVTNTSLALANTQFIESRVQEDDVEIEQPKTNVQQGPEKEELIPKDLIANVCESIKQGLSIMDEKYRKMEVVDSDSEDEGNKVLSVILGPNDPYQNRPLPYVIGSEKWKASSKIGLESSSSESEQLEDDEEEESESDKNNKVTDDIFNTKNHPSRIARLSSSSSESDNFSHHSDNAAFSSNGKLDATLQSKVEMESELATPARHSSKANPTPNFAEELAKRLGNVRQVQKPVTVDEANEKSINRSKDDLFAADDKDDIFCKNSEDLFNQDKDLFDDKVSSKFWNEDVRKPFKGNVIPPSIDVPPPISAVSTKPKSAIDDLFGDADSDDSDDIFSSKTYAKKTTKESKDSGVKESLRKKHIDSLIGTPTSVATSTPTNLNADNLFNDDEDDDGDLFGSYKKQTSKSVESSPSGASNISSQDTGRKKPIGGISILGNVLASDIESKLSSRILQRRSSESSSETVGNTESMSGSTMRNDQSNNSVGDQSLIVGNIGNIVNASVRNSMANAESGDSSGISIRPPSINNTGGSGTGADFQPVLTSTRLKSEEIFRERVQSDSLFASQTRATSSGPSGENRQDDVFENEELFGPPPLPATSSKIGKSKVPSLFDDSDSGDELFSAATSSGSRSQRSADLLQERSRPSGQHRRLFDEDVDILAGKDAPEVDIFGATTTKARPRIPEIRSDQLFGAGGKMKARQSKPEAPKAPEEPPEPDSSTRTTQKTYPDDLFGESDAAIGGKGSSQAPKVFRESSEDLFADQSYASKSGQGQGKFSTQKIPSEDLFGEEIERKAQQGKPLAPRVPDESPVDLFGDSFEESPDIFSVAAKPRTDPKRPGLKDISADEFAKEPARVVSAPKKTSLFDDDEDDDEDDLFGVRSAKAVGKVENLFVTDDLFAATRKPTESSGPARQTSSIEPGMSDRSAIEPVVEAGRRVGDVLPGVESNASNKRGDDLFDDEIYDDLFGKKSPTIEREEQEKPVKVKEEEEESMKEVVESADSSATKPKLEKESLAIPQVIEPAELKRSNKDPPSTEQDEGNALDPETKKQPPKTLNIRGNDSTTEENAQPPRRAVSGKIKDLMGRMGDLKILSPTDTPPLWRKSEEKTDEEEDEYSARDSDDGGCVSVQSRGSPPSISEGSTLRSQSARSTISGSSNAESAVSFDQPAQVETLSAASKNRVRVPANRRPQSRHARQTALRKSGIDFDAVDEPGEQETSRGVVELAADETRNVDGNLSAGIDDRSEIGSVSKESSVSANKNTLLSPSTDEEDLFDVPPDLPDDTLKEDALFGRAPLLSPIERIPGTEKPLRETFVGKTEVVEVEKRATSNIEGVPTTPALDVDEENDRSREKERESSREHEDLADVSRKDSKKMERDEKEDEEENEEPIDPLRDTSHDPLKDPSQLFAFVTKTPSPEKGKNLLFADDDSLFASGPKRSLTEKRSEKKSMLDLFEDDDTGGDLFSVPLAKPVKRPLRDTKIGLFDDEPPADNDEDSLFGAVTRKPQRPDKARKNVPKLFDDLEEDEADLFSERSERTSKASSSKGSDIVFKDEPPPIVGKTGTGRVSNLDDIFGDNSSGDDDLFAAKKPLSKRTTTPSTTRSIFLEESGLEGDSIFARTASRAESKSNGDRVAGPKKKSLTRDLRKTAEKIDQDPLSLAQDD